MLSTPLTDSLMGLRIASHNLAGQSLPTAVSTHLGGAFKKLPTFSFPRKVEFCRFPSLMSLSLSSGSNILIQRKLLHSISWTENSWGKKNFHINTFILTARGELSKHMPWEVSRKKRNIETAHQAQCIRDEAWIAFLRNGAHHRCLRIVPSQEVEDLPGCLFACLFCSEFCPMIKGRAGL